MLEDLGETVLTDEELAAKVQKGSEIALETLIDRYEAKLIRYGQRFLGAHNKNAIQEAVQDIFIAAYHKIESFDTRQRFSPWIYRIAHNAFIDLLRNQSRQPLYLFDFDKILPHALHAFSEDTQLQDIEKEKENAEMHVLVEKSLDKLAVQQREIIVLYYFEDLSYKEIADVLHIPVGTVGVRLLRAKNSLKKVLPDSTLLTI